MTDHRIKLTRLQANDIDYVRKNYGNPDTAMLEIAWRPDMTFEREVCTPSLDEIEPIALTNALMNGYDVEKTAEEKLREYYDGSIHLTQYAIERVIEILVEKYPDLSGVLDGGDGE